MRTFFLALTAAAAAGASAQAQDLMDVTFGTNWLPQAEHGGYYQAVADGTYKECGLNVTIAPGGPQVNNRALLLAGRIEFHMGGNLLQAFSAVEQDIPLKVVAAHMQKEPQIIMTHPDQGLDTFESLKTIELFIGENGFQSYYQWMMDEYGFTAEQRKPYTFNPAPFLADKRSGQQGYVTSEPFAIETVGGFVPNIFLLADYGFDTYATTVETMQETIQNHPEAVQCFVDGSAIGWVNYLYGDPSAANELIKTANPEMTDEQLAYSIEKMKEYGIIDSGEALSDGIGAMTAERIEGFYNKMVAAGVTPEGLDLTKMYTLDFVNKGIGNDLKAELTGK
ncbi:MAG: ABC transporter substrate-binding protein [Devosia sp.]